MADGTIHALAIYVRAVLREWKEVVLSASSITGLVIDVSSNRINVPWGVWVAGAIICLFVAQFKAFNKLRLKKEALVELLTPKLVLEFKHGDKRLHESGSYENIDPEYQGRWEKYERYSVRVTNTGTQSIEAVRVEITDVEDRPAGMDALPFRLQTRDNAEHCNPGESIYAYVADFDTSNSGKITLYNPTHTKIPASRYILAVQATGKDVPAVTKKFSIHVIGNRLYMHEEPSAK